MTNETAIQILQAKFDFLLDQQRTPPPVRETCVAIDFAIETLRTSADNKNIRETAKAMYEEEKRLRDKYEGNKNGYRFSHRVMALRDLLKKIGG